MPDISRITLPSGNTYDLKDATARSQIEALTGGDAIIFIGVSTTALTDGGTETPTVGGQTKTPAPGHLFFYGTQEFIWGTEGKWHELGSLDNLGDLAYKDSASGNYQPKGSISAPVFTGSQSSVTVSVTESSSGNYTPSGSISGGTFSGSSTTFTGKFTPSGNVTTSVASTSNENVDVTVAASGTATYTPSGSVSAPTISIDTAGSTTTIKNPTSVTVAKTVVAAAPGATAPANALTYYSVSGETLSLYQLGYTTGASITTSDVTVKNGDASYTASVPSFTGIGVRLITDDIAIPSSFTSSFSGTEGNVSTTGTPEGSNSAITFSGNKVSITGTTVAEGSNSQPTFTGTQETITVS